MGEFAAEEDFTVNIVWNGLPFATDHWVAGGTRGDGLTCNGSSDYAGSCG